MKINTKTQRNRKGIAYILALLLLALFSTLAAAMATSTNLNLQTSDNHRRGFIAQTSAESGLTYYSYLLKQMEISDTSQELLVTVKNDLISRLPNHSICDNGTNITISPVSLDDGSFSAIISQNGSSGLCLQVTGRSDTAKRLLSLSFVLENGASRIFQCGIISNGPLFFGGNANIKGVNNPGESDTLCLSSLNNGVTLGGNSLIEGDVSATNPDSVLSMGGNSTVAGYGRNDPEIDEHFHPGASMPTLPEIDTSQFKPLATRMVTTATSTSGNFTMTNIRILANTNKTFSGNYTLKGVIYIESPNKITFTGNTTIQGVIVTQDAGDNVYASNTIEFRGNTTIQSSEVLPYLEEFETLKQLTGSFLLAPGFGVTFRGNFGSIGGTIAADKFTFQGNSGGTIHGSIINYGNVLMEMKGNSHFNFDQSNCPDVPAGFTATSWTLKTVSGSYKEY